MERTDSRTNRKCLSSLSDRQRFKYLVRKLASLSVLGPEAARSNRASLPGEKSNFDLGFPKTPEANVTARVNQSAVLVQTQGQSSGAVRLSRRLPTSHVRSHSATRLGLFFKHGAETSRADSGVLRSAENRGPEPALSGPPPPRPRRRPCHVRAPPYLGLATSRSRSPRRLPTALSSGPPRRGRIPTPQARAPRPRIGQCDALASARPRSRWPREAVPGAQAGGGLRAGGGRGSRRARGGRRGRRRLLRPGWAAAWKGNREELTRRRRAAPAGAQGGQAGGGRQGGAASRSASVAPARLRRAVLSAMKRPLARKRPPESDMDETIDVGSENNYSG